MQVAGGTSIDRRGTVRDGGGELLRWLPHGDKEKVENGRTAPGGPLTVVEVSGAWTERGGERWKWPVTVSSK